MKILYIAFKGKNNTSYQLVSRFNAESFFITNSFKGAKRDILSVNETLYDKIVMFGSDKNLIDSVKIELTAALDGKLLNTCFDIDELTSLFEINAIKYSINDSPTTFLCNTAYYYMLNKNPNTIFIHIPSIKYIKYDLIDKLVFMLSDFDPKL